MKRLIALTLVALVPSLTAQDPMIKKIVEEGQQRSHVMDHLNHLTNRIGPRLTGSDRLTQAADWAVEQLQSWGLDAKKEQWGTFPVGFNRGPSSGRMLEPKEMAFTFATRAWSAGTTGRAKGEAIMAPKDVAGVRRLAGKLAGKWIVKESSGRGGRRGRRRGGAGGGNSAAREAADLLTELCKKEGALGTITSSGQEIVKTSGNYRISWDTLPTDVAITVTKSNFDALQKALKGSKKVVLEFDIRNWFKKGPIPLYNVIADLKGTEKPDEYVVIGGHLDSWDGATGTTDNGTGSSTALEAARILATCGAKPKRTIRFMLWSGEEQGLLGSAAWCKQNQDMLGKISGCFVHDGGTNYVGGIRGTPTQQEQLKEALGPCTKVSSKLGFTIGETRSLRGGGSDHGSYLAHGVPGYFWSQKGRATYSYGWHTQNDTYDLAIPEYQRHSATVIALGAYGIANLDKLLDRTNMRSTSEATPLERRLGLDFTRGTLKVSGFADERGVAARAGVKKGDVLVELDGVKLKGDRFILRATANNGEPKKKLVLDRGGKKVELDVNFRR
ncbi:MAG: M20/M25/M40 family metallo-hydrolase [Planctomycetes bacterium]|nr:M20/M25/M40 family metallo-hydrolase [Planctomycetota bacterium]